MRRIVATLATLLLASAPALADVSVGNGSIGVPLGVINGGTGLTSLTGSLCIRSSSSTALAEAAGDCVVTTGTQSIAGTKSFSGQIQALGAGTSLTIGVAAGTVSQILMTNASGAATQSTVIGNGVSNFGATCGGIVPTVFAVAGTGGTVALCTDVNGNVGTGGSFSPAVHVNQSAASQWAKRVALVSGTTTFTFATAFTSTPVCVAIGEGSVVNILKAVPSTTNCVVTSASGVDTQTVDIVAIGNPS